MYDILIWVLIAIVIVGMCIGSYLWLSRLWRFLGRK
ncbi:hypothetical protein ES708_13154 [subsurface metagenome]